MGQVAFVNLTPLSDIDLLVTNASPNDRTVQAARELGVEILHVEPVGARRRLVQCVVFTWPSDHAQITP